MLFPQHSESCDNFLCPPISVREVSLHQQETKYMLIIPAPEVSQEQQNLPAVESAVVVEVAVAVVVVVVVVVVAVVAASTVAVVEAKIAAAVL